MQPAGPNNNWHYNRKLISLARALRRNMTKAEACLSAQSYPDPTAGGRSTTLLAIRLMPYALRPALTTEALAKVMPSALCLYAHSHNQLNPPLPTGRFGQAIKYTFTKVSVYKAIQQLNPPLLTSRFGQAINSLTVKQSYFSA